MVGLLATLGVVVSTALVGLGFWALARLIGFEVGLLWCLVFGALISPTDPLAVVGILRSAGVPANLEAKIAGESLFNDGVGVVVVSILVAVASGAEAVSLAHAGELFLLEAGGGVLLGLAAGYLGFVMIRNRGVAEAMSERTRNHLLGFWSLLDEILNSVLFLIIGLEVIAIAIDVGPLLAGLLAIPVVLAARAISVGLSLGLLASLRSFDPGTYPMLVWGGLRGGISIALALTLPEGPLQALLLTATYVVVVFSVAVQGTTVGLAARRLLRPEAAV